MEAIVKKIESIKSAYIAASHEISSHPELGTQEFFAMKLLTGLLENEGFTVRRGIAGYETGFIAQKGSGTGPTITFLAEYDALPGLGHACGHNIIGTAAVLAAAGLAAASDINGRIMVHDTPAEEGMDGGCAKAAYVALGIFTGVDAALMLHPGDRNKLTPPTLAVKSYDFEFFGKPSHAAAAPEKGVNALDAVLLFFNGVSFLRQQTTDDTRIHGIITDGGRMPNIIPDYTKAKFLVRGATKAGAEATLARVIKTAEGAALATGCTVKVTKYCNDYDDTVITPAFDALYADNAVRFGLNMESDDGGVFGSSDAGNVSYVIPVIQPTLKVTERPCPIHTAEFARACVSPYADEALVNGAKALACTAYELLTDTGALHKIKAAHAAALLNISAGASICTN